MNMQANPKASAAFINSMEPGAPNLDGMDQEDLFHFAMGAEDRKRVAARKLFGTHPHGPIALMSLVTYAWNKITAMQKRLDGDIASAILFEDACEKMYRKLPEFARW